MISPPLSGTPALVVRGIFAWFGNYSEFPNSWNPERSEAFRSTKRRKPTSARSNATSRTERARRRVRSIRGGSKILACCPCKFLSLTFPSLPMTTRTQPRPSFGAYVDLLPDARGDLRLQLTLSGIAHSATFRIQRLTNGVMTTLATLLADHLETDWELLEPAELAALTSAPLLGTGIDRDDEGVLRGVEHLYWFPDYAVRDEIEELLTDGAVSFDRAPNPDDDVANPLIVRAT